MKSNLDNNYPICHDMGHKDPQHTRVEQFQEICNSMNLHAINYMGCPEINLDPMQQKFTIPSKALFQARATHVHLTRQH
eukprot:15366473-Ditylum_brightwellii.AAC.2